MKKYLFDSFPHFLHGGDYNPEQWIDTKEIWDEDMRLMQLANCNEMSVGIFSWSTLEPKENEYDFSFLDEILDKIYKAGGRVMLATPSGARPHWMADKYPEVLRVRNDGHRNFFGRRHNHCYTSPYYRQKTFEIDTLLAKRYADHPAVIGWHISNEFGGDCFCPLCKEAFRDFLKKKYKNDIKKLNFEWWTTFWSHRYNSFDQIEPPFKNGETSVMGLNLEWKRFTTYITTDFMKAEIETLHKFNPSIPTTANLMKMFSGLDYNELAKEIDVVSWDSYPQFHNDYETLADTFIDNAFDHALMRSLKKDRPFMLMESAPGLVNWHAYNKLKKPGIHRLACIQAVASGSDTVQSFQFRKGRGSYEQYHGAVVDHVGTDDTRVFREVAEVGELLKKLAPVAGTCMSNKVAILFDWDNRWSIRDTKALADNTKSYEKVVSNMWKALHRVGIEADIIPSTADFSDYKVILAPMLYMLHEGTAANLKKFVADGGQLLSTYFTGYIDKDQLCWLGGFPGDGLADLFGVISEEIDTYYQKDRNHITFNDSKVCEVRDYAEILRVTDADVLATYNEDFYAGTPAVTLKKYGKGSAYYVAARITAEDMMPLFEQMLSNVGIETKELPENIEYHKRTGDEGTYEFYLNFSDKAQVLENVHGTDLVSGAKLEGKAEIQGYNVLVVRV